MLVGNERKNKHQRAPAAPSCCSHGCGCVHLLRWLVGKSGVGVRSLPGWMEVCTVTTILLRLGCSQRGHAPRSKTQCFVNSAIYAQGSYGACQGLASQPILMLLRVHTHYKILSESAACHRTGMQQSSPTTEAISQACLLPSSIANFVGHGHH